MTDAVRSKEVGALVAALVAVQEANRWTDAQMAARLQVARSMWGHVQSGEKEPGPKFLRGVVAGFPNLADAARACFFSAPRATPVSRMALSRARTPRQEA